MSDPKRITFIIMLITCIVLAFVAFDKIDSAPVKARIEKIATVKLDTGALEVIAIYHRGQQCYLVVGQSTTRLINMKADLVCP